MTNVHDWTQPIQGKKKTNKALIVALVIIGCLGLMCGVGIVLIVTAPAKAPTISYPAATPESKSPPPPAGASKAPPAKPSIKDGEWTAGTDFPVGTYETTTQSDRCVWQVTTGQGDSVKYVDPGHIGPGHYKFTFKAGQTLHTVGCGTWAQQ